MFCIIIIFIEFLSFHIDAYEKRTKNKLLISMKRLEKFCQLNDMKHFIGFQGCQFLNVTN